VPPLVAPAAVPAAILPALVLTRRVWPVAVLAMVASPVILPRSRSSGRRHRIGIVDHFTLF